MMIIRKCSMVFDVKSDRTSLPLHGVAADGGSQAALVVFQGVVHCAFLVDLFSYQMPKNNRN